MCNPTEPLDYQGNSNGEVTIIGQEGSEEISKSEVKMNKGGFSQQ